MPSLYDKLMEKTVKESQPASPSEAQTPQEEITRKPEIPKSPFPDLLISRNPEIPKSRKEENPKGGNPEIRNTRNQDTFKVPKYYTQLPQALQDEIKVYAIRHKLNDYEVVTQAIEEFFKKQK
jgi:hypothetical protein